MRLKGLGTSLANAPPHAPSVLAPLCSSARRRRERAPRQAIYSCGVGYADAALKRWHYGREDRGADLCAPRFAAVLEHRAPSALAPARRGPPGSG